MRRLLAAPAVILAALITLVGCGSAETPATGPAPAASSPEASTPADSAPATTPGSTVPGVPALTGTPSDLTKPTQARAGVGKPPAALATQDVVAGKGPVAALTDTVNVRYTGTLYSDGTVFDSSWSRGDEPVGFPLDGVVPGFAQGITGMQPGGRRVMVIPPALGYGDRTQGPIPGGSTLVFVVDLVSID